MQQSNQQDVTSIFRILEFCGNGLGRRQAAGGGTGVRRTEPRDSISHEGVGGLVVAIMCMA